MDIIQIKENDNYNEMMKISVIGGNNYRIKKAINKARKNEKVTILYLGGSITKQEGYEMEGCYTALSFQYFKDYFNTGDNIIYINSGIAGTDSTLALMRLDIDILPYRPDIVFVEFAVNDAKDTIHREVFESLIISLLESDTKPAVIPIFMLSDSGYSCQGHMQVIGEYYNLPMISVKDALTWGITNHIMKWSDYSNDNIHPNQCGHSLTAEFIAYYYREVDKTQQDEEFHTPTKPFYDNSYVNIKHIDARNVKANTVGSFRAAAFASGFQFGWKHNSYSENESFRMKLNCKNLFAAFKESNTFIVGNAEVYIDGSYQCTLNGYRMFAWDNSTAKLIFSEDECKEHLIEVRMASGDEEKEFSLLAFGYSTDQVKETNSAIEIQDNRIELSPLISDGMVLQRNSEVRIWGSVRVPGKKLILNFIDKEYQTEVDQQGNWEVILEGLSAGGPYDMQINYGEEQRTIYNILIGDVWVLGGQSNMQIPVKRTLDLFEEEVKDARCPFIRQFIVSLDYDFHSPRNELTGGNWFSVTPGSVYDFSAVGYFYAKELYEKYQVPIGLILTALGGTPAQAWMSEKSLMGFERFQEELNLYKNDDYVKDIMKKDAMQSRQWYSNLHAKDAGLHDEIGKWYSENYNDSDWKSAEIPFNFKGTELEFIKGSVWFRKEIDIPETMIKGKAKLILGTIIDADDTYINGIHVGNTGYLYPPRRYEIPEGVLKKGKNVITVRVIITGNIGAFVTDMPYFLKVGPVKLPISGTWKYHIGCVLSPMEPTTFFQNKPTGVYNAMIYPLKKYNIKGALWYQGETNTGYPYDYKNLQEAVIKDWRATWDMGDFPFLFVQLPNYCPWKLEPEESSWAILRDQQRQAMEINNTGMAVALDVGEYNELHPQNKKVVGERLALWARHMVYGDDIVYSGPIYEYMERKGDTITLHFNHIGSGLISRGRELKMFEICGKDNKFVAAKAIIVKDTVCVSSEKVKEPVAVRYAWADNPEEANLYNLEELPASPFIT